MSVRNCERHGISVNALMKWQENSIVVCMAHRIDASFAAWQLW